jgi:hypothetical protein
MIGKMPETSFCFCLAHFSGMIFIWISPAAKIAKTLQVTAGPYLLATIFYCGEK